MRILFSIKKLFFRGNKFYQQQFFFFFLLKKRCFLFLPYVLSLFCYSPLGLQNYQILLFLVVLHHFFFEKEGWLYFRRATFFRLRLPLYFIFLLILFAFILSHPKKNRKRTKYPLQNEKKKNIVDFLFIYIFPVPHFWLFYSGYCDFFGHYLLKCCFVGRLIYFFH